jgi:hypothetical protein
MRMHGIAIHMLAMLAVLAVSIVPCAASIRVNDNRTRFNVQIPFEFVVGDRMMPAGRYRVEQLLGSSPDLDVLLVRCLDVRAFKAITATVIKSADPQLSSRLVFHRYGSQTFLAALWIRGAHEGLQLRTSITESQAAQNHSAQEEVNVPLDKNAAVASSKKAPHD